MIVDRAAVANGDDGVPHEQAWLFAPTATVTDLLIALATGYFPQMGMWTVYAGAPGSPGYGSSQRLLGLVNYDLGHVRSPYGALLTPIVGEAMTLPEVSALFDADPLMVFGGYRSGLYSQLATLDELRAARGYTGADPIVLDGTFG